MTENVLGRSGGKRGVRWARCRAWRLAGALLRAFTAHRLTALTVHRLTVLTVHRLTVLTVHRLTALTVHRLTVLTVLTAFTVPAAHAAQAVAQRETDPRRDAVVIAVEKVLPSIVNISTETVVESRDSLDDLFRDFFGPYYRRRPPDAQKSLGSGVIIDDAGYILTNFHVVRRASRITVTLVDGREFQAKAISRTAKSDVALLKIVSNERFQPVQIGADDDLLLGETVLALGNPFGLGVSVSRGILSSKTRRPPVENEPLEMEDWLQTDAAINPGNSGGPLINLRGELIGLNVAVFREGQGIGFAIPAKRLSQAVSEIFTPEEIKSLWFGARFKTEANGVVTVSVQPASPADKGGLKAGDVILKINGKTPKTSIELNRELVDAGEAAEVSLQVRRKGERRDLAVRLVAEKEVFKGSVPRQKLGLVLQPLTGAQAAQLGLSRGDGLMIAAVERNSPAAEADLRAGYVLQAIDGQPLESVTAAAKLLYGRRPGERVELRLIISRVRGNLLEIIPAKAEVVLR